jgi:hypothetical protein
MVEINIEPTTIQDAAEDMLAFIMTAPEAPTDPEKYPPIEFASWVHRHFGPFFRNSWNLWWYPGHKTTIWPQDRPKLLETFEKSGISNPDDIIVLTAVYAWSIYHNKPIHFLHYINQCKAYWAQRGYPNGLWSRYNNNPNGE